MLPPDAVEPPFPVFCEPPEPSPEEPPPPVPSTFDEPVPVLSLPHAPVSPTVAANTTS